MRAECWSGAGTTRGPVTSTQSGQCCGDGTEIGENGRSEMKGLAAAVAFVLFGAVDHPWPLRYGGTYRCENSVRVAGAVRTPTTTCSVLCAVRLLRTTYQLFSGQLLRQLRPPLHLLGMVPILSWLSPPTLLLFILLPTFLRRWRSRSISPTTPLFLFGASSGGKMATLLGSRGGFQLCDKRTTYVQVSGVMSQVQATRLL